MAATVDTRIATILQRATGLEPALLGPSAVRHALQARMQTRDICETGEYARVLAADAAELQALIEAVVVPETWFFRHPGAFTALLARLPQRIRRPGDGPLHILCAPCSTGEEAYSIAIALLDAGLAPEQFEIDARDISAAALAMARRGIYGNNAFRSHDLAFRARHFTPQDGGWRIDDRVRASVRFGVGNLVAREFGAGQRFDAIFCRNVLIYFPREVQLGVLNTLTQRLADDGLLFVGPAEGSLALAAGLRSLAEHGAFGFFRSSAAGALPRRTPFGGVRRDGVPNAGARLGGGQTATLSSARRSAALAAPGGAAQGALGRPAAAPAPRPPAGTAASLAPPRAGGAQTAAQNRRAESAVSAVSAVAMPKPGPASGPTASLSPGATAVAAAVRHATTLSDAGRLDAADAALGEALATYGPSADAFYLKGALADARGRADDALDCYRKALYLDANHRDTLLMLSARLEARGDRDGARRLLGRARRAEAQAGGGGQASGVEQ
ncbi:CheR family methyltransferase [Chitinasiproducens palmae]|nr:CheR family methyltransferase [Chitinasiproducens palmae]